MTSEIEIIRAWDAVVVIDFLEGNQRSKDYRLRDIVADDDNNGRRILVSRFCTAEVAYFGSDTSNAAVEETIVGFFDSEIVVVAELTDEIAKIARDLTREFRFGAADAVHVATAIYHGVPLIETFDCGMLQRGQRLNEAGKYGIDIARPALSGQSMLQIDSQ